MTASEELRATANIIFSNNSTYMKHEHKYNINVGSVNGRKKNQVNWIACMTFLSLTHKKDMEREKKLLSRDKTIKK
jgi:hypothetical protein